MRKLLLLPSVLLGTLLLAVPFANAAPADTTLTFTVAPVWADDAGTFIDALENGDGTGSFNVGAILITGDDAWLGSGVSMSTAGVATDIFGGNFTLGTITVDGTAGTSNDELVGFLYLRQLGDGDEAFTGDILGGATITVTNTGLGAAYGVMFRTKDAPDWADIDGGTQTFGNITATTVDTQGATGYTARNLLNGASVTIANITAEGEKSAAGVAITGGIDAGAALNITGQVDVLNRGGVEGAYGITVWNGVDGTLSTGGISVENAGTGEALGIQVVGNANLELSGDITAIAATGVAMGIQTSGNTDITLAGDVNVFAGSAANTWDGTGIQTGGALSVDTAGNTLTTNSVNIAGNFDVIGGGTVALASTNVTLGGDIAVTGSTLQFYGDTVADIPSSDWGYEALNLGADLTLEDGGKLMVGNDTLSGGNLYLGVNTITSVGSGNQIVIKPDTNGSWSTVVVGDVDLTSGDAIEIVLDGANRDTMASAFLTNGDGNTNGMYAILVAQDYATADAGNFTTTDFATSRYIFTGQVQEWDSSGAGGAADALTWGYSAGAYVALPDISALVTANTVAFELPRAQYTNGPWVIFKGGDLDVDGAQFANTFQDLQVGYDKNIGKWNAGAFFEAAWLWGRGTLDPLANGNAIGGLFSANKGTAGGLYLSRTFRNKAYFDIVGRVTRFDNEVKYSDYAYASENYSANWKNNMFSLGLEVGKNFTSRDGRWAFNPYNRVVYNSASAQTFDVAYANSAPTIVTMNGFGAWTNRLGARLTLNQFGKRNGFLGQSPCDAVACDPCAPCGSGNGCSDGCGNGRSVSRMFFVGADWYKGFAGKFGGSFEDALLGVNALQVAHAKNDLSYAKLLAGVTFLPRNNVAVSFMGETLFGDVEGYGLTTSLKVSF